MELTDEFKNVLNIIEDENSNVFITGKAGTGKSTLLEYFRNHTSKNIAVLAPTGVAALNVKGQTIHSFFKYGIDITTDKARDVKSEALIQILQNLDTIVIDEISMVRADLIDCINISLQTARKTNQIFGGIQMIFFGDLFQLPPVITREELQLYSIDYSSPYFFDAISFNTFGYNAFFEDFKFIELTKVFRQTDQEFINILNNIRVGKREIEEIKILNQRIGEIDHDSQTIYLTTTNAIADRINTYRLNKLPDKEYLLSGDITGEFDKNYLPTDEILNIKIGAQIMMLNNDRDNRWINGSIGTIIDIEEVQGQYIIRAILQDNSEVEITPYTWEILKYKYDTERRKVLTDVAGDFTQYPFKLAWAITIHKSQGKTFDNVIIDLGWGAFAQGQLYVALSRCKSLEGITLKRNIQLTDIKVDERIKKFYNNIDKINLEINE